MKSEILPYQRVGGINSSAVKKSSTGLIQDLLSKNNIFLLPLALLLGRGEIMGGMMPFGLAFYAATAGMEGSRILTAIVVLFGMFLSGAKDQIYIATVGMILFNGFCMLFSRVKIKSNYKYALIGVASAMVPLLVTVYLQGFLLFDLLQALTYVAIVFSLVFIFRKALPVIQEIKSRKGFTSEEMISIGILSSLALSGFGELQIAGLGVKNILCVVVILMFSFKCGPAVGASIGVTIGMIVSLSSSVTPLVIGTYALCGLLAGVLRSLGKVGSGLGFVLGNAILTIYLNGASEVMVHLKEISSAVLIFIIIPGNIIESVAGAFSNEAHNFLDKKGYSLRIKEITVDKLNKFSSAFKELSKTFGEISQTAVVTDKQDITGMFDRIADKVCKDCSLCLHCWDRNFYSTYQVMFKIMERLDTKGHIEEEDIPEYFLGRCERINDFIAAVNNVYEIFKVDLVWKSRIGESRGVVSQQLDGLSRVISNLASEINVDIHFKKEMEDDLLIELNRAGVKVSEVIVFENKSDKFEINVFHKGCGGNRNCSTSIEKIVSQLVGRKMTRDAGECYQRSVAGGCALKLVEEEELKITTGVAKISKEQESVSGDSYTFLRTGDGKYIAAISDGMGTGHRAATQSRAAINLLEQFMESGFDKDTAIKLINSILVLKSSEDNFATIDMSVIDLYNGDVEFVKIGAAPTYIKRGDNIEAIKSASLPAGILSNIEIELTKKKLDNGDIVVMASDGVVDAFKKPANSVSLMQFMSELNSVNPQQFADAIMEEAYSRSKGTPQDDMLVLIAKVWRKIK